MCNNNFGNLRPIDFEGFNHKPPPVNMGNLPMTELGDIGEQLAALSQYLTDYSLHPHYIKLKYRIPSDVVQCFDHEYLRQHVTEYSLVEDIGYTFHGFSDLPKTMRPREWILELSVYRYYTKKNKNNET